MEENTFLQLLERFECRRGNECCKKAGFVYLRQGEAERLAAFLGLDIYEFTGRYCDLQDRQKLILKQKEDKSCVFLSAGGCAVHPVKPAQCRDFPVRWRTLASFRYCAGLKALFGEDFQPLSHHA